MENSSTEDSSSDYSTESSEDDGMETAQINGIKIQLPQGLCERQDIFRDIFTSEVWNSFSDVNKQHLQTFLPNFPENDELEKTKTLQRLFDFDIFKFYSPLAKFHNDLKAGYFRPDIARMRKIIQKAEHKEAKYRYKTFKEQLKHEVIQSQVKLLNQIRNLPPGVEPKQERRRFNIDYVSHRTKRRYFQTLSSIRSKTDDPGCSSDENYPEGPPISLSKKQKRHLNSIKNSLNNSKEKYFTSTMYEKSNVSINFEKYIVPNYNPFYVNDESYKNLIYQHKKRKLENPEDSELKTKGITISDIIWRTQLPYNKNMPITTKHPIENKLVKVKKLKKEHHNFINHRKSPERNLIPKSKSLDSSNTESDSDSIIDPVVPKPKLHRIKSLSQKELTPKVKKEPSVPTPETTIQIPNKDIIPSPAAATSNTETGIGKSVNNTNLASYDKITPVRVEDLDGIDVMNIPIDLDNSEIDILELSNKPELMQDTHANFFSLIRDVICSTNEHRMNMYMLQERLKSWQENPISPLNDWYSYADNWISILPSAITFLCGNASEQPDDFVPYMEYKVALDVYQWIGAGRDSDGLLSAICTFWLEHRTENKQHSPSKDSEIEVDIIDRSSTPPPPRFPTTWTVRKATLEEIKDFREQERRRYDNPHKAFTYRCNNYESVVGPLKGIYNPSVGNTKARGHTMLSADRPNFVTILSLVRDAAARLPNGEGTRAEICELLKSSQYISSSAPDNLLQSVVSGALDRMHTQWDPCVKYDQKRKIWIYLHRNRTEEDFERIHQQYQGINKAKKPARKSPAKPKIKTITEKSVKPLKLESSLQSTSDQQTQLTTQEPLIKPPRRPSASPSVSKSTSGTVTSQNITSNLITVASPQRGTSLLLSNNLPKQQQQVGEVTSQQTKAQSQVSNEQQQNMNQEQNEPQAKEDKEINEALQAIIQNRVSSPTIKTSKSVVKIISPSQGKSLIIPTSNPQIIKQIQEQRSTPTKQLNQVVTQQLLQTIAAQQKQILVQKQSNESGDSGQEKIKASVQQQILQTINPQQLQNIKNVTLLRARPSPNLGLTPIVSIAPSASSEQHTNIVTVAVSKQDTLLGQPGVQIKTSGNLTPAQQQQILQTIKQKILPNASVLTSQQQIILKQKGGVITNTLSGATKVIGQQKLATTDNAVKTATSQGPVVAKVLTNAAGQVISVESLLAHQKQQGSLPQGTTLRVSSSKGGQQNIIHLTGTSKSNAVTQFAVASQSNILTLTSQPKLVMASPTTPATSVGTTKSASRITNKSQTVAKLNAKANQQLINAKLVTQGLEGQKIVQPKLVLSQQNQLKFAGGKNMSSKPVALNVSTSSGNTIRMVNAANLNLTNIGGKPVLLASKGGTIQSLQGQNVILQTQSATPGASLVLQNSIKNPQQNQSLNQSNIVFTPQMKVQPSQQVVLTTTNAKTGQGGGTSQSIVSQGHIVLGGHPVRLQTTNASNAQRVVLASQGQGGQIVAQQILLPAGFQGTAINIKALQGVKVIPIAQAHGQGKGVQSRQVFARLMNPSLVKQTTQANTALTDKVTEVTLPSHSGE